MEIAKKIGNGVLIFVTVIAVFMSCLLLYFNYFGKDKIPTAITSTYATTVTDPLTGEELPVLEANYYSNRGGSGYEVVEFRVNAYSGVSKQGIYARGFQMVWDKNGNVVQHTDSTTNEKSNVWYYDSYDNVSFETGHKYEWGDKMIIDIDGETYGVALDGQYTINHKNFNLGGTIWNGIKNTFTLQWGRDPMAYNEWSETFNYTFEDLLLKIRQIIKSCSNGTGDGVISLIDLGDFLHIYEYDEENGQFKGEPVGGNNANNLINSYFTMQTHYDNRGMAWYKQSLFSSVAGDNNYNITGLTDDVDYWKATTTFNLTEQDFESRYSQIDNGFYYILPTSFINELKDYKDIEINITFNVSNLNVNVLGFDYYALNGIKVNSLTITSSTQRDFRLLVGSLKDTGLTSTDIILTNINLINTNSGVEL